MFHKRNFVRRVSVLNCWTQVIVCFQRAEKFTARFRLALPTCEDDPAFITCFQIAHPGCDGGGLGSRLVKEEGQYYLYCIGCEAKLSPTLVN
jgi:hypothetical protein